VPSWVEVEAAAPELAAHVRRLFDAHRHKTIATLRADGSPRISGTETQFRDGDLWIGSMLGARKADDLRRDPRFALHSGSVDPPEPAEPGDARPPADARETPEAPPPSEAQSWPGDAKIAGRMIEVTDPALVLAINGEAVGSSHLFRADITEVSVVRLNHAGDKLLIESWHPDRGIERIER
jgi:hypothetical protein